MSRIRLFRATTSAVSAFLLVLLPSGCGLESSKAARHSISRPAVIEVPVGATLPAAAPGPAPVINEEIVDMSLG